MKSETDLLAALQAHWFAATPGKTAVTLKMPIAGIDSSVELLRAVRTAQGRGLVDKVEATSGGGWKVDVTRSGNSFFGTG